MDYRKLYRQLCDRGQIRSKEEGVWYEVHHIKPRSFKGTNEKSNLTTLTLREHYVAHLLLVAIYPDSPAMMQALWNMCNVRNTGNGYERYKPSNRTYDRVRGEYMTLCRGKNASGYGRSPSEEQRKRISEVHKGNKYCLGMKHPPEVGERISRARKALNIKLSDERKEEIRESQWGGKCYKAKKVINTETGEEYGSGREVSEHTGIPFGTVRRWLNGSNEPPESFKYKRVCDIDKSVEYKNKRSYAYGHNGRKDKKRKD